jgi:hypothetical protein
MNIVQFLKVDEFKTNTPAEQNIDDNKITPAIWTVQEEYLLPILGSTFYDYLEGVVVDNTVAGVFTPTTITVAELELIRKYIKPFLVKYTLYEVMMDLSSKLTNKGVNTESSEFSQPVGMDVIGVKMNRAKSAGERLAIRLRNYLCKNISEFPVYANPDADEIVHKADKVWDVGIFISKYRNHCRCNGYCRCGRY